VIAAQQVTKVVKLANGDDLVVLRDISLNVGGGQMTALMGRSGSGKSTLLNLLGLLDRPTAGEVLMNGAATSGMTDAARSRLRGGLIGFVFQQYHLLEHRSALANVVAPLFHQPGVRLRSIRERGYELLASVGLADRADATPSTLSGGEQQRVAIARALVCSPGLVLADEPTGALDADTAEVVLALLLRLVREHGASLLLATHDPVVSARADAVVRLDHGQLTDPGP
jgi:putative ABC transport system ATP-binding protein